MDVCSRVTNKKRELKLESGNISSDQDQFEGNVQRNDSGCFNQSCSNLLVFFTRTTPRVDWQVLVLLRWVQMKL